MVVLEEKSLKDVQGEAQKLAKELAALGFNPNTSPKDQQLTAPMKRIMLQLASMGYDSRGNQIGSKASLQGIIQANGGAGEGKMSKGQLKLRLQRSKLNKYGFPLNSKQGGQAVLARKNPELATSIKMLKKKEVIKRLAELGYTADGNKLNSPHAAKAAAALNNLPAASAEEAVCCLNACGKDPNGFTLGSKTACVAALHKAQPVKPMVPNGNRDELLQDKSAIIQRLSELGFDENGNKIGSLEALLTIIRKETGQPVKTMTKEEAIAKVKTLGYDRLGNKTQGKTHTWKLPDLDMDKNGNPVGSKPALVVIAMHKAPTLLPSIEAADEEDGANLLKSEGICPLSGHRLGSRKQMAFIIRKHMLMDEACNSKLDWEGTLKSSTAFTLNLETMRKKELRKKLNDNGFDHEGNSLGTNESLNAMLRKFDPSAKQSLQSLSDLKTKKARLAMLGVDQFGLPLGSRKSMMMIMHAKGMECTYDHPLQLNKKFLSVKLGEKGYDFAGHRIGGKKSTFVKAASLGVSLSPHAVKGSKKELMGKANLTKEDFVVPKVQSHGQAVAAGLAAKLPGSAGVDELLSNLARAYPDTDVQMLRSKLTGEMIRNVGELRCMQPEDWAKMGVPLGVRNRVMACI